MMAVCMPQLTYRDNADINSQGLRSFPGLK